MAITALSPQHAPLMRNAHQGKCANLECVSLLVQSQSVDQIKLVLMDKYALTATSVCQSVNVKRVKMGRVRMDSFAMVVLACLMAPSVVAMKTAVATPTHSSTSV